MTVGECLKGWLGEYGDLNFSELLTDFMDAPEGCMALFRSPQKQEKTYLDGSKEVTEYYNFFARKSTLLDETRVENQQLLDDLTEWIENKAYEKDYPDLSQAGNLACEDITVNGASAINSQEDDNAIYQITIAIQYLKER